MINEKNIFERGMLVNLRIGAYSGRKKMAKDQLKDLPTEIVRGVHDLFDKEFKKLLTDIQSFDWTTRFMVRDQSIPFPIDGVYFIPSERIEKTIEMLDGRQGERIDMIEKAVENYEAAVKIFAEKYPDYYSKAQGKYPSKEEFSGRFHFKYQLLKMSAPSKDDNLITPEMYKMEMKKFKETVEEMKAEVVGTIAQVLLETVGKLKKQCTDGKVSQRTFNSLNEYLKRIDDLYSDFIDRDDLKKMIAKVKAETLGISAESLRDSDASRQEFKKQITVISEEIQNLPNLQLKRAIEF